MELDFDVSVLTRCFGWPFPAVVFFRYERPLFFSLVEGFEKKPTRCQKVVSAATNQCIYPYMVNIHIVCDESTHDFWKVRLSVTCFLIHVLHAPCVCKEIKCDQLNLFVHVAFIWK